MKAACPDTYVACVRDCGKGPCKLQHTASDRPKPPSVTRPTMLELMMNVSCLMARRSTCARLQVGCVITDLGMTTIYSIGYNGNYRGGPNECDREDAGDCGCLHAEDNALVKLRTETKNLMLFTTHSPCPACAKRIVNQGNIRTVWYGEHYRLSKEPLNILGYGDVMARMARSGTGVHDDVESAMMGKRYLCWAVFDEHTTLDACRQWDGATVTKPVIHGEGCRCTYELIT